MELLNEENHLIERIERDICNSSKERIVLLSGHFPVSYMEGRAYEDLTRWGCFSAYTLQLGARLGKFAKSKGRKVSFALISDDLFNEKAALDVYGNNQLSRWRGAFYKEHSGPSARVHPTFEVILDAEGFSSKDVIRQDHKKEWRESCLYISEKVLRAQREHIKNECAKAYLGFLENQIIFDKEKDHLVAFIPTKCRDNICEIALPEVDNLSVSHIFMPSVKGVLPSDMWGANQVIYQTS